MRAQELLGMRLRELRKNKQLTQEELAEKAGLDVKFVGSIERGGENPSLQTMEKLANALSVKPHQILTMEHQLKGEKLLQRRINQILDKCDERELQFILKLVSALKD